MIRRLGLGMDTIEDQFRRMVFYVVAGNQDDHVKNTAFLMNKQGQRSLSPADDVTYANENMDGEKVLEATGAELMSYGLSGSDSGQPLSTHQGSCWHYLFKQI